MIQIGGFSEAPFLLGFVYLMSGLSFRFTLLISGF